MIQKPKNLEELAAAIKEARLRDGLTQTQIAERMGVPQSQYQTFESAKKDTQISSVYKTLDAVGLEMLIVPKNTSLSSEDPVAQIKKMEYEDQFNTLQELVPLILDRENTELLTTIKKKKNWRLTRALNFMLAKIRGSITLDEFMNTVDPEPDQTLFRFKSGSTSADVTRLCNLIESGSIDELVLGVKLSQNNGRELVGYTKLKHGITVLFDNLHVNHARDPRIWEIQTLVKCIESRPVKFPVLLVPDPVPATRDLPVEDAWEHYKKLSSGAFSVERFLALIAPDQFINLLEYRPDAEFEITVEEIKPVTGSILVYVKSFLSEQDAIRNFEEMTSSNQDSEGKFYVSVKVRGTQVTGARVSVLIN